jgi:hypothetical protein
MVFRAPVVALADGEDAAVCRPDVVHPATLTATTATTMARPAEQNPRDVLGTADLLTTRDTYWQARDTRGQGAH